jgi:hypothetical protein
MAAEMLIEQLTLQNPPPRQHLIAAELVVRDSTGPAPRGRGPAKAVRDRLVGEARAR